MHVYRHRIGRVRRPGSFGPLRAAWLAICLCGSILPAAAQLPATLPLQRSPIDTPSLRHVMRVTPRILSGAQPDGDAAFAELAGLGVRTIVSVDGIPPDVAAAQKHGLRYVHVPIGYDGVDDDARRAAIKLSRSGDDLIYVHCHHGQHRGPAFAATLAIATGELDREQAVDCLTAAGTGKQYAGLWRSVGRFDPDAITGPWPELVSQAPVDATVTSMNHLAHSLENFKDVEGRFHLSEDAALRRDAIDRAVVIEETYRELIRHLRQGVVPEWIDDLHTSHATAMRLQSSLRRGDLDAAHTSLQSLATQCTACHTRYRD